MTFIPAFAAAHVLSHVCQRCALSDPRAVCVWHDVAHYWSDGSGRDGYICLNNGGLTRATDKPFALTLRNTHTQHAVRVVLPAYNAQATSRPTTGAAQALVSAQARARYFAQQQAARFLTSSLSSTGQSFARMDRTPRPPTQPYEQEWGAERPQTAWLRQNGAWTHRRAHRKTASQPIPLAYSHTQPAPWLHEHIPVAEELPMLHLPHIQPAQARVQHVNNFAYTHPILS